jgi:hypothetical protein
MNRQQKREAHFKRGQRYGKAARNDGDILHNRIAQALVRVRLMDEVRQLRTRAGLQAFIGDDAAQVADAVGRMIYIVAYAAGIHNLGDTPEARVLRGTAHALGDVAATPAALDHQRAAIISGLAAVERPAPHLHEFSLAAGAQELDRLLRQGHVGTLLIEQALRPGAGASEKAAEACAA